MTAHWTRKITFGADANDWVVLRDGLVVGRVMLDDQQSSRLGQDQWAWSVITMPSENGYPDSIEAALEEIRARASDKWGHKPHGCRITYINLSHAQVWRGTNQIKASSLMLAVDVRILLGTVRTLSALKAI
ncbi:hypothetical protein TW83_08965 [Paracoccus sp. S4493]|nr:hypothetical protein TW83_08965 [Paracoccus sp. S4493]